MGGPTAKLEITSNWNGQSIKDALFGEDNSRVIDTSFGSVKLKGNTRIDGGSFQADIGVLDADATNADTLKEIEEAIHDLIADMASGNPDAKFEVFVIGVLS